MISPRVSMGMPVYNGESTLPRALDSLLAQNFGDFEIVISDNASEDRTGEICLAYSERDSRIRYTRNATNLGQIANFNRVFELSRGEYFRWVGCNDWWSPQYLERCVCALDGSPRAVLATCFQKHYDVQGRCYYEEHKGPRVDSDRAHRRLARMLWFFRRSRYLIDPIYSMIRRDALEQTSLFPAMLGTDHVLAAELSLIGPFCHVPLCLSFRQITPEVPLTELCKRFDPQMRRAIWHRLNICRAIASRVRSRPINGAEKTMCMLSLARHFIQVQGRAAYRRGRRVAGTVSGYKRVKTYLHNRSAPLEQ